MADNNQPYLDLVTSEYAEKTKFNQMLSAILDMECPIVDNLDEFNELFNLDNAVGDQLDICGQLVGLTRELPIEDPDIPDVLDDDLFRAVIKARICSNHWNGTNEQWQEIITQMFPDAVFEVVDNQDMTISVVMINPNASAALTALLFNGYIVPKPAGVKVNWTIMDHALFGWDRNTSFVKGWDDGIWSDT